MTGPIPPKREWPSYSSVIFLECATDGAVLWISDRARQRLGPVGSLVDRLGAESTGGFSRFLMNCGVSDTFAGVFERADGSRLPIIFSCCTRSVRRILLAVEARERAADRIGGVNQPLLTMQTAVLEKYFRLLRMQQALDSRLRRRHGDPGLVLIEQLERERARLARELHSGAGQSLSAINVHLELIEKQATQLPAEVRHYLDGIARLVQQAAEEVRAVSRPLHPPDWKTATLADALRSLWNNSGIPERYRGSLRIAALEREPNMAVRVIIYRAAQEALANTVRHSGATTVALALEEVDGTLRLSIRDNGTGFDPAAQAGSSGIGLRSIREQVEVIGGGLRISTGPGGTALELSVPLETHYE